MATEIIHEERECVLISAMWMKGTCALVATLAVTLVSNSLLQEIRLASAYHFHMSVK